MPYATLGKLTSTEFAGLLEPILLVAAACCHLSGRDAVQAVTSLVFTLHSGGLLLSGGEDTVVSTWALMDVLDASLSQQAMQQQPPVPLYSWSAPSPLCCTGSYSSHASSM